MLQNLSSVAVVIGALRINIKPTQGTALQYLKIDLNFSFDNSNIFERTFSLVLWYMYKQFIYGAID